MSTILFLFIYYSSVKKNFLKLKSSKAFKCRKIIFDYKLSRNTEFIHLFCHLIRRFELSKISMSKNEREETRALSI